MPVSLVGVDSLPPFDTQHEANAIQDFFTRLHNAAVSVRTSGSEATATSKDTASVTPAVTSPADPFPLANEIVAIQCFAGDCDLENDSNANNRERIDILGPVREPSKQQRRNATALRQQGHANVWVFPFCDAAFATAPGCTTLTEQAAACALAREAVDRMTERQLQQYAVNLFLAYAIELAMLVGQSRKPQINFGIARAINVRLRQADIAPMGMDIEGVAFLCRWKSKGGSKDPSLTEAVSASMAQATCMPEQEARRIVETWMAMPSDSIECMSHLADSDFEQRLSQVPGEQLLMVADAIPIDGWDAVHYADHRHFPEFAYAIRTSALCAGEPLTPPLTRALGPAVLGFSTPCEKPSCIVFIDDIGNAASSCSASATKSGTHGSQRNAAGHH